MPITHLDYLPFAEENEGCVPWMYLDTRCNVTVGIGHKLAAARDAEALPFVEQGTGQPATGDAIRAAYAAVGSARHLATRGADAFVGLTSVRLPRSAILAVYEDDFDRIARRTRHLFMGVGGGFDAYPDPVQIAVIDMAFNLGPDGLYNKYPKFRNDGLARHDFTAAAAEAHRRGVAATRNSRTVGLLLAAARGGPQPGQTQGIM